jgi:hypothetical protein
MTLAALYAALVLAALPVRVEATACPSGAEVESALLSMLPSLPTTTRPDVARVVRRDRSLLIELVSPDAAVIAERTLDLDGSCADLAAVVAVVIASWESDVRPEFTRSHAELPLAASPAKAVDGAATSRRQALASYDVALGPSLSFASSSAAGGMLAGTWVPRGTGLGLRLFAAGETTRTVDLGSGQARWRRWIGSVETDWRFVRGRAAVDVHAGLALGWLSAAGIDFPQNQSQLSFSPGATVGVRWSWWTTRHLAVWLDLMGLYWSRSQTIHGDPVVVQREVPHFQGLASVGLALGQIAPRR